MARRAAEAAPLLEGEVDGLSHDGRGVARVEGKAVFIDGALPGERVCFRRLRQRRGYDSGELVEVLRPSPHRVAPRCPVFGTCGGCRLQHLDPAAQVEVKQSLLLEDLARIGGVEPERVLAPVTGPVWGYRRRGRLGVRRVPKKGGVLVGFRERAKRYITDMTACPVLVPAVGDDLSPLRALVESLSIADRVPQIEVAAGDRLCALVFRHLLPLARSDRDRLAAYGRERDLQIWLQPGGPETAAPLAGEDRLHYRLPEEGVELGFRATDFIQVNAEVNRRAVALALELLAPAPDEGVLDLFCGLGNFSLPLARRAGRVLGLEGEAGLVARARDNARTNGLEAVRFERSDLYREDGLAAWLRLGWDKVLLDPPRTGAMEVVKQLGDPALRRVVYVSCNPATLARDSRVLVQVHGYRLEAAGVLDMFPHTQHAEAIALFSRER